MATGAIEETGTQVAVAFGKGGLVPTDLNGAWKCAQLVARSGLAPRGVESPEAILVAATMGAEIGLSFMQSLQNIAVINGRPSIWGDAALALVLGSSLLVDFHEEIQGEGESMVAVCSGKRVGGSRINERRFSVDDAKTAGLWGKRGKNNAPTPWITYPKRMLQMRARGFFLRDLFPDVLKGIKIAEEAMDTPAHPIQIQAEQFDITEEKQPQPSPGVPTQAIEAEVEQPAAEEQPEAVEPEVIEPERRRRTKEAEYLGEVLPSAGITGVTYTAIMGEIPKRIGGDTCARSHLDRLPTKEKTLTYMREEEGAAMLAELKTLAMKQSPEPTTEEPPATEAQTESAATLDQGTMIVCEDNGGDEMALSYCEETCKASATCQALKDANAGEGAERNAAAAKLF